jgi:hypothetical protein
MLRNSKTNFFSIIRFFPGWQEAKDAKWKRDYHPISDSFITFRRSSNEGEEEDQETKSENKSTKGNVL